MDPVLLSVYLRTTCNLNTSISINKIQSGHPKLKNSISGHILSLALLFIGILSSGAYF